MLPFRGNPSSREPFEPQPDIDIASYDPHAARAEALRSLSPYEVELEKFIPFKEPEITDDGSKIEQKLAIFKDISGKEVIREVTVGTPNQDRGGDQISPFPIISSDPWTTGPHGLNRNKLLSYVALGYPIVWVHHAGRHTPPRKDKSISRAAHQEHVLLDYLTENSDMDTTCVIGDGYSRGAMIREKFIALAERYDRHVPYSDTEALVFARDMSTVEKLETVIRQVPSEARGLIKVVRSVGRRALQENNLKLIIDEMGIIDFHPRNMNNEAKWIIGLINSQVGHYVKATPVDMHGTRTFFSRDHMSQRWEYEALYAHRPNVRVIVENGAHVEGATFEYRDKKRARFLNLMTYMQSNGMSLSGFQVDDILQPQIEIPTIGRRKRHLRLIS